MTDPYVSPDEQWRRRQELLRHPAVQRSVARLRVTLDRRAGIETPQWILDLARDDDDLAGSRVDRPV